jgi:hypothetical protein
VLDEAKAAAAAGAPFDQPPAAFCNLSLSTGFHRVMGAYYPFTVDGDFIEGSIRANPALELKVFDHLASAFNLNREDVTWDQLDSLIDTSKGQFALLDALNYLSDQPKSLYRHNGARHAWSRMIDHPQHAGLSRHRCKAAHSARIPARTMPSTFVTRHSQPPGPSPPSPPCSAEPGLHPHQAAIRARPGAGGPVAPG